jgi:hypothetical protein
LNAHPPSKEKNDDSKDSFCEELEQVFHDFLKYHTEILVWDFNAKLGREDIFKPTIRNKSLHQDNKESDVRIVNFATLIHLVVKSRFSRTETFISTPGPLQIGRLTTRLITY